MEFADFRVGQVFDLTLGVSPGAVRRDRAGRPIQSEGSLLRAHSRLVTSVGGRLQGLP
jgi:hypothetical protein